ncbi:MAG: hypothetical protein WDN03_07050 [Rhizomicrobium sp.]
MIGRQAQATVWQKTVKLLTIAGFHLLTRHFPRGGWRSDRAVGASARPDLFGMFDALMSRNRFGLAISMAVLVGAGSIPAAGLIPSDMLRRDAEDFARLDGSQE